VPVLILRACFALSGTSDGELRDSRAHRIAEYGRKNPVPGRAPTSAIYCGSRRCVPSPRPAWTNRLPAVHETHGITRFQAPSKWGDLHNRAPRPGEASPEVCGSWTGLARGLCYLSLQVRTGADWSLPNRDHEPIELGK